MFKEEKNMSGRINGFIAFIPNRLLLSDRPELAWFPLNILIGRYTIREGKTVLGNVLYAPDLESFGQDESEISMNYLNPDDAASFIKITIKNFEYEANKYFQGKSVGASYGVVKGLDDNNGWQMFFTHVGIIGLTKGEHVMFSEV